MTPRQDYHPTVRNTSFSRTRMQVWLTTLLIRLSKSHRQIYWKQQKRIKPRSMMIHSLIFTMSPDRSDFQPTNKELTMTKVKENRPTWILLRSFLPQHTTMMKTHQCPKPPRPTPIKPLLDRHKGPCEAKSSRPSMKS